eukprot:gene10299-11199_t
MDYLIRQATIEEIRDIHIGWSAEQGWNPGRNDWRSFSAIDPSGFFVGVKDGKIVACVSALRIAPNHGYIGYYICKKEHRGKGYGLPLFQAGLKKLWDEGVSCIGLDGVLVQVPNYEKSGFVSYFKSIRHLFVKNESHPLTAEEQSHIVNAKDKEHGEERLRDILALQQSIQTITYESYYRALFQDEEVKALSYYSSDNEIVGFGVIRPAMEGYRVGPLYANDAEVARVLFKALVGDLLLGSKVIMEIALDSTSALGVAESFDMTTLGAGCMHMYTQPPPPSDLSRVFALQSWTIGP